MNKTELIYAISEKSGLNKKSSEAALNAAITTIEDALKAGDKVVLVGFGTFEVRHREARKGRNPQTSEPMMIPESKAPVFKAGKSLKDMINV